MHSIRLTTEQITRLRKSPSLGASIIKFACKRYRTGEIVIQNRTEGKICESALQVFPLREKPEYPDSQIRMILDAHFANPRDYSKQLAALDEQIKEMMKEYAKVPLIVENNQ